MKLAATRRSFTGMHWLGLAAGLWFAWGTLAMGVFADLTPSEASLAFSAAFGAWMLAWILIPLIFGRDPLRPEYFALLPLSPRRLAVGLLAATFVGILALVTLLALAGLVAYAARIGPAEAVVAVVSVVLLLLFLALLSKVVVGVLGEGMKSRLGRELVAMQFAVMLSLMSLWPLVSMGDLDQASATLERAQSWLESGARYAPTGWGPAAVMAAQRSEWLTVFGALAGLAALCAALLVAWSRLLVSRLTTRSASRTAPGRLSSTLASLLDRLPATPTGGVARKEILTWLRDPWRALELRTAIWTAALMTGIALLLGLSELLPYAGLVLAGWGVLCATNLYGLDGTALWQTELAPRAVRSDVRGRQIAWLLVFVPLAVIVTITATVVSGAHETWPWTLAVLPALLFGGSGLAVLVSVYGLAPLLDPQRRSGPYDSSGDNFIPVLVAMAATPLLALPAFGVVAAADAWDLRTLRWLGLPVGVVSGVAFGWGLGLLAAKRLESNGPELLHRMRSGKANPASSAKSPPKPSRESGERPAAGWDQVVGSMPSALKLYVQAIAPTAGAILLVPQAIIPAGMKLTDNVEASWFLTLHLPRPWHWPAIALMFALGLGVVGSATYVYLTSRARVLALADQMPSPAEDGAGRPT